VSAACRSDCCEFAQARRIKGFIAEVLLSNHKMIRRARAAGDLIEQEDDEDRCKIKTTFYSRPALRRAAPTSGNDRPEPSRQRADDD
jgi:hypothetical protein